jgi:polar amino acid transport system permease protein
MKGFDFQGFLSYFGNGFLWEGVLITLWLTALPIAGGLVLGTLVALMRMSGNPWLVSFARFYIWIFRGTPLLIQLVIVYAGLPQFGIRLGVVTSANVALT